MGVSAAGEICGELRASDLQHQTPIVLAGTTTDEDMIARALFAGADDYIVPSRKLELRARIRVQLRNKRYRDALAGTSDLWAAGSGVRFVADVRVLARWSEAK